MILKNYYYEEENYIIVAPDSEAAWLFAIEQCEEDAPLSPSSFTEVEEDFVPEGGMTYFM